MGIKSYNNKNVLDASIERIEYAFDNFEKVYVSFSGGKDSTVMFHLAAKEAIKRNRTLGVLIIDLEAQYNTTIKHIELMLEKYNDIINVYWVCLPLLLRNAVSQFEPRWCCWEKEAKDIWVREFPLHKNVITQYNFFNFFEEKMEFEEFMVLFGIWYSEGRPTCGLIGIRSDESLNRFRTISSKTKECHNGNRFTTKIHDNLYNLYPIYDWKTEDIWRFHAKFKDLEYNAIYDRMHKAGLAISQMRLCQPYGDDQRRGLWLYHILEPYTWYKVVARVNGANSGALYIEQTGNITGYNKITKPDGHSWKSFCNLLLSSLPKKTRDHYISRFKVFINGWKGRGYYNGIPDEAPKILEDKQWAPSYRRLCKVILRNDWWCKGLGLTQPKSDAYGKYLEIKKGKK